MSSQIDPETRQELIRAHYEMISALRLCIDEAEDDEICEPLERASAIMRFARESFDGQWGHALDGAIDIAREGLDAEHPSADLVRRALGKLSGVLAATSSVDTQIGSRT